MMVGSVLPKLKNLPNAHAGQTLKLESLVNALGIECECVDLEAFPSDKVFAFGDTHCLWDFGAQLVSRYGVAVVYFTDKRDPFMLHEACHAILGEHGLDNETLVFALEYTIAHDALCVNELERWYSDHFFRASIFMDGSEADLQHEFTKQDEWIESLKWLERNGFTLNCRPVYGIGQHSTFESQCYHEHVTSSWV